jgi:hypothetical protein
MIHSSKTSPKAKKNESECQEFDKEWDVLFETSQTDTTDVPREGLWIISISVSLEESSRT